MSPFWLCAFAASVNLSQITIRFPVVRHSSGEGRRRHRRGGLRPGGGGRLRAGGRRPERHLGRGRLAVVGRGALRDVGRVEVVLVPLLRQVDYDCLEGKNLRNLIIESERRCS